jgi:hypothetical protein
MPSCQYSICGILMSIVNEFWSMALFEDARYFRPGNACGRCDAGYIYPLLMFELPPSGTSDGRFSQD